MESVVRIPKMILASSDFASEIEVDMGRQVLKQRVSCQTPLRLVIHSGADTALRYGRLLLNSLAGKSATSSEPDDSE